MKIVSVERGSTTIELSMAELGLIMNALWEELGYQEPRSIALSDYVSKGYEALQKEISDVIAQMDALPRQRHE